jgi:hypothetical protein
MSSKPHSSYWVPDHRLIKLIGALKLVKTVNQQKNKREVSSLLSFISIILPKKIKIFGRGKNFFNKIRIRRIDQK